MSTQATPEEAFLAASQAVLVQQHGPRLVAPWGGEQAKEEEGRESGILVSWLLMKGKKGDGGWQGELGKDHAQGCLPVANENKEDKKAGAVGRPQSCVVVWARGREETIPAGGFP